MLSRVGRSSATTLLPDQTDRPEAAGCSCHRTRARPGFEELVLESIACNPALPIARNVRAGEELSDRLEGRGVWQGCDRGCTCADCLGV
jgi:hypothetical protein